MNEQMDILHLLLGIDDPREPITLAEEYYLATGKTTYWQDSQGKPARWWEVTE